MSAGYEFEYGDSRSAPGQEPGRRMGLGIGLGLIIGVAMGLVFDSVALGIGFGGVLGLALGAALAAREQGQGASPLANGRTAALVGIGLLLLAILSLVAMALLLMSG